MLNLPNIITIGRLALLPVIILLLYGGYNWIAFGFYVIAAITDFFDGWLARKYNLVTPFGTFLDPIADKVFVGILLVGLIDLRIITGLWVIAAMVILIRELLISGLREFLGPHKVTMPVTKLAKWKTTVQMLALGFLVIGPALSGSLTAGLWLLALAAVLTIITGWGYMKVGLDYMKKMP